MKVVAEEVSTKLCDSVIRLSQKLLDIEVGTNMSGLVSHSL